MVHTGWIRLGHFIFEKENLFEITMIITLKKKFLTQMKRNFSLQK